MRKDNRMKTFRKLFLLSTLLVAALQINADTPIPKINFVQNSIELNLKTNEGYWKDKNIVDIIDFFVKTLNDNPNIVIQITGYCDSSENKTKKLSRKRAKYIRNLIIQKNIAADRVKIIGKGVDTSVFANETEADAAERHKRVLIAIVDFDYKTKK